MQILLPNVIQTTRERKAHPFPGQIAFQTLELMQASMFHAAVMDTAAGQRVRQSDGIQGINQALLDAGLEKIILDNGWKYLEKYQKLFERFVTQRVLIDMRSQWDWYVRNLGGFILAGKRSELCGALSKTAEKNLEKIGFEDISTQITILEKCADIKVEISNSIEPAVLEMSLVRNLGLHNRWEVDDYYLKNSKATGWKRGEIRIFEVSEMEDWHQALTRLVNATWPPVAIRFKDALNYSI